MDAEKKTVGMTTGEKVAYLRGLADGMDIRTDSREGRLLYTVLDVLDELASDVNSLSEDNRDIWEAIDGMNSDIEALGEIAESDGDAHCCGCGCHGEEDELPELDGEPGDFTRDLPPAAEEDPAVPRENAPAHTLYYEVQCPVCSELITLEETVLAQGYIVCPKCGERLEFDLGEDDEETPESLPEYDYPDEADLVSAEDED